MGTPCGGDETSAGRRKGLGGGGRARRGDGALESGSRIAEGGTNARTQGSGHGRRPTVVTTHRQGRRSPARLLQLPFGPGETLRRCGDLVGRAIGGGAGDSGGSVGVEPMGPRWRREARLPVGERGPCNSGDASVPAPRRRLRGSVGSKRRGSVSGVSGLPARPPVRDRLSRRRAGRRTGGRLCRRRTCRERRSSLKIHPHLQRFGLDKWQRCDRLSVRPSPRIGRQAPGQHVTNLPTPTPVSCVGRRPPARHDLS